MVILWFICKKTPIHVLTSYHWTMWPSLLLNCQTHCMEACSAISDVIGCSRAQAMALQHATSISKLHLLTIILACITGKLYLSPCGFSSDLWFIVWFILWFILWFMFMVYFMVYFMLYLMVDVMVCFMVDLCVEFLHIHTHVLHTVANHASPCSGASRHRRRKAYKNPAGLHMSL